MGPLLDGMAAHERWRLLTDGCVCREGLPTAAAWLATADLRRHPLPCAVPVQTLGAWRRSAQLSRQRSIEAHWREQLVISCNELETRYGAQVCLGVTRRQIVACVQPSAQ